jgi:hypothetical protein
MKYRESEFEGTPEEYAAIKLINSSGASSAVVINTANHNPRGVLPDEVLALTGQLTNPVAKELAEEFVRQVLLFGLDIDVKRGKSSKSAGGLADYIQFRKIGSQYGAFTVFNPPKQRVKVRLSPIEVPPGFKFATTRNVQEEDVYKIVVRLTSKEAVQEAVKLARLAYDAT